MKDKQPSEQFLRTLEPLNPALFCNQNPKKTGAFVIVPAPCFNCDQHQQGAKALCTLHLFMLNIKALMIYSQCKQ